MVAEPTLFLSEDCMLQVRAHRTRSGLTVYCVCDFIRVIVNKPELKPSDAMVYWMSAACSKELCNEHNILDQYPIRFIGAYEPRNICLNAGGLLLLFDYLDRRFKFIWPQYKEEARRRLLVLSEGGGSEYVWDHDDGEVDEMMAARDAAIARGEGLDGPPKDWKYYFDDAPMTQETAVQLQECVQAIERMEVVRQEEEGPKVKKDRKTAFCIKDLIGDMKLDIDPAHVPALCKTVCTRFREIRPKSDVFTKMRRTFFYQQDRECLEDIVHEEFIKYASRRAGEEFENETI
jgi:hypothetical protein